MTSTTSSLLAEKLKRLNSNEPQEMAETLRAFLELERANNLQNAGNLQVPATPAGRVICMDRLKAV